MTTESGPVVNQYFAECPPAMTFSTGVCLVSTEGGSAEEVASVEVITEVVIEEAATGAAATEEVAAEKVITEEAIIDEAASEKVATEEFRSEEVASEDVASEEIAREEGASEELVTEQPRGSQPFDRENSDSSGWKIVDAERQDGGQWDPLAEASRSDGEDNDDSGEWDPWANLDRSDDEDNDEESEWDAVADGQQDLDDWQAGEWSECPNDGPAVIPGEWASEGMREEDIVRPKINFRNRAVASRLSEEAQSTKATLDRLGLGSLLGEELELDLRCLVIDNATGHRLLEEGMKLLQGAFYETSRVYWPLVFWMCGGKRGGSHLVDTSMSGMSEYFKCIEKQGLLEALPGTADLRELLVQKNKETRNKLCHPLEGYDKFKFSSELDIWLQVMQAATLIMGDQDKVARLRRLRDELAEEAKRVTEQVRELSRRAEDPSFEISEDDLEFLHDWNERFYNILHEQRLNPTGHRLDKNDPMLRIAEFYSNQRIGGRSCAVFANGGAPEYW
ncbi:hypothetical protein V8F20_006904 [Naviculisporaceae sp. PSN 640]